MGNICGGGSSNATTQAKGGKKKAGPSNLGDEPGFLALDSVVNNQRRLTKAERDTQAQEMLSFKGTMKFKVIERFATLYSKRKEIGQGAFGTVHIGQHR